MKLSELLMLVATMDGEPGCSEADMADDDHLRSQGRMPLPYKTTSTAAVPHILLFAVCPFCSLACLSFPRIPIPSSS